MALRILFSREIPDCLNITGRTSGVDRVWGKSAPIELWERVAFLENQRKETEEIWKPGF